MTFPALNYRLTFFTFLWTLAFTFSLMLIPQKDAHLFMACFITLSLSILARIITLPKKDSLSAIRSPLYLWLGGFWLVAFISVLNSQVPFVAYVYFCFIGTLPLSFLYSNMERDKTKYFTIIGIAAITILSALSVWCLIEYFFLQNWLFFGRTHYPLANSNSLGALLSIGFFTAAGTMLHANKRLYANIALVAAALIFSAIITTQSRGAFLSLIFMFSAFCVLNLPLLKKHARCLAALVILCVLAFLAVSFPLGEARYQTPAIVIANTVAQKLPLLWDRPHIWLATWEIIKTHFWQGTGIGTFFLFYPEVRHLDYSTSGYMAHNDPLQFWSEMGVFAPIVFYGTITWLLMKTYAALKHLSGLKKLTEEEKQKQRIRIIIPVCIMAAIVLQSHIEFNFYVLPVLLLMGTLLTYWLYQIETLMPAKKLVFTTGLHLENIIVKSCMTALVVCLLGIFLAFQGSELLVYYAKQRVDNNNLDGFVKNINFANQVSFNRNGRALMLAGTVPSGILRSRQDLTDAEKHKLFAQANSLFKQAAAQNPRLSSIFFEMSLLSEYAQANMPDVKDQIEDPQTLMEKAFKVDPLQANSRGRLADLMIRNGHQKEALALLKDGLQWPYYGQDAMPLYQRTAQVALEMGDTETQESALRNAASLFRARQGR